jgi:putative NIF3 family GTP cyclohydrolase 1 type 2
MLGDAVRAGCDTFVTADVRYDLYLRAKAMGITLMDAGHYATENVVFPKLIERLAQGFPQVEFLLSQTHQEAYGGV